jgi:hypothetical protein
MNNAPDVEMISENDVANIKQLVPSIIKTTYPNLRIVEQELITKHLTNLVLITSLFYYTPSTYFQQITLNNNRDIFSMLVLLMPFYELPFSAKIKSLDALFESKNINSLEELKSSFYIDHPNINIEDYFQQSFNAIYESMMISKNKLCYNWVTIFPYTMETIKESDIYKNFWKFWNKNARPRTPFNLQAVGLADVFDVSISAFNKQNYQQNAFLLGYDTLFGCCYNFLYNDIKQIKWMIYDIHYEDKILPTIVVLADIIKPLRNVCVERYGTLTDAETDEMNKAWGNMIKTRLDDVYPFIKSLLLFYLRWETDEDELKNYKQLFDNNCQYLIRTHIKNIYEDGQDNDNFIYNRGNAEQMDFCLKSFIPSIKFERLHEYIFVCMQQFRYTWYAYVCLDDEKNIKMPLNFVDEYATMENGREISQADMNGIRTGNITKYYITPKNIYNYFKNLIHGTENGKFTQFTNFRWNALSPAEQNEFIGKINSSIGGMAWFNITNNIRNMNITADNNAYMNILRKIVATTDVIPMVILQTLIYNGILTYTKYNPPMSDDRILPDKQTQTEERKTAIYNALEIDKYKSAYLFWDNLKLEKHNKYKEDTGKSYWYMNFGSDWMAQTQIFHHFNHQRVILITGGTGAGKSTITPFMMVYALKIINYNNNGKVFCTQPRIQPVVGNASWIAFQLGIPIKKNEFDKLEGATINYVQYKHGESSTKKKTNGGEISGDSNMKANATSVTDDFYHPTLRLLTDGSLFNTIKKSYIFKAESNKNSKKIEDKFIDKNIFDVILIDEAHEHNVYMDMILTLSKFANYVNNQITLGIISATMETDEVIYRKYYQAIDDTWRYPIRQIATCNRQLLDRRLHLSVPFGSVNYEIEMHNDDPRTVMAVLNHILANTMRGDILIFQAGAREIQTLTEEINKTTKRDVYAIPFYAELDATIRDTIVKEIQKERVRNNFRIPKNVPINEYFNLKEHELLPRGTYKRFVIVATNIAEASITIDTLKFVIDTVKQKVNIYNIDTNVSKIVTKDISKPSSMQRRGRVGRASTGTVYRLYDFNKLNDRVDYKICTSDIKTIVFSLITEANETQYFLTNDPYRLRGTTLPCIANQYTNVSYLTYPQVQTDSIVYPYNDGRYSSGELEDVDGKLFIISPDEDELVRGNVHDLAITERLPDYKNKVGRILEYFQKIGLRQAGSNLRTDLGDLIDGYVTIIDDEQIKLEYVLMFIDCVRLTNGENVINKIILYIVFSILTIDIKPDKLKRGYADYLVKAGIVPETFYSKINIRNFDTVASQFNDSLTNINSVVKRAIIPIKEEYQRTTVLGTTDKNIENAFQILDYFYALKVKLMFLTNNVLINKYLQNTGNIEERSNSHPNVKLLHKILGYNNNILKSVVLNRPMNEYEFVAYVIAKNNVANILLKVQGTNYYINYFNRDVNVFFEIANFMFKDKRVYLTSVDETMRNNIILHIPNVLNDSNMISNIMMIPASVVDILRQTIEITRNTTLDVEKVKGYLVSRDEKKVNEYYNAYAVNAGKVKDAVMQK